MKAYLTLLILIFSFILDFAMEHDARLKCLEESIISKKREFSSIKEVFCTIPSLKFIVGWHIAHSKEQVYIEQIGEQELLMLINKIRTLQLCDNCLYLEKKFFINLINNPNLSVDQIKQFFPDLIEKYLGAQKNEFNDKVEILNSILVLACEINDTILISLLLDSGANVNIKDKHGYTPLLYLVKHGETELTKILLAKGAEVNVQNEWGNSPLILASAYSHIAIVKLLLDAHADVNAQSKCGYTALIESSKLANKQITKLLLNAGANVNLKNYNGNTALMEARRRNNKEVVKVLIKAESDLNFSNQCDSTALKYP